MSTTKTLCQGKHGGFDIVEEVDGIGSVEVVVDGLRSRNVTQPLHGELVVILRRIPLISSIVLATKAHSSSTVRSFPSKGLWYGGVNDGSGEVLGKVEESLDGMPKDPGRAVEHSPFHCKPLG